MNEVEFKAALPSIFDPKFHVARDEVDLQLTSSGETLAKNVLAMLRKHYPKVADGWRVWVNEKGGIVMVKNHFLSGRMGFILHVAQIDTEYRAVVRAGGELLERHRVARDKAINVRDQLRTAERRFNGDLVYDL